MIRSEDRRAGLGSNFAITASAATGVEDSFSTQFGQFEPGLCFKRRSVFVVMRDFVAIPLKTETGEMFLLDEPRNSFDDGMVDRTLFARDRFGRHRQRR